MLNLNETFEWQKWWKNLYYSSKRFFFLFSVIFILAFFFWERVIKCEVANLRWLWNKTKKTSQEKVFFFFNKKVLWFAYLQVSKMRFYQKKSHSSFHYEKISLQTDDDDDDLSLSIYLCWMAILKNIKFSEFLPCFMMEAYERQKRKIYYIPSNTFLSFCA